jgi:DNA-binding GntR family transcriptional regulator
MCATDTMSDTGPPRAGTELVTWLGGEIVRYLREENPPIGSRLTERALAERLQVSRSPVRTALRRLHEDGFVDRTSTGGYLVARSGATADHEHLPGRPADDEAYLRIAADRLDGLLPERVTKSFLLQRYQLTRSRLDQLLIRISNEGWIAPLPGYGWIFLPVLTSLKAYNDSYRFRLLVEPAGILEPTFRLDRPALRRRRAEQLQLAEGGVTTVSNARLFELNTGFHQTIAEASGNAFLAESLVRINRLRRLIEYRQALNPDRAVLRCREHVHLADLLLNGRLPEASACLRTHLSTVGAEKSRAVPAAPGPDSLTGYSL